MLAIWWEIKGALDRNLLLCHDSTLWLFFFLLLLYCCALIKFFIMLVCEDIFHFSISPLHFISVFIIYLHFSLLHPLLFKFLDNANRLCCLHNHTSSNIFFMHIPYILIISIPPTLKKILPGFISLVHASAMEHTPLYIFSISVTNCLSKLVSLGINTPGAV